VFAARALKRLSRALARLHLAAIRNRAVTLGVAGAVLVVSLGALSRLRVELNYYESPSSGLSAVAALRDLRDRYKDGTPMLLVFKRAGGAALSEADLCHIRDWLHRQANENVGLAKVTNPFEQKLPFIVDGKLTWHSVLEPNCESPGAATPLAKLAGTPWQGLLSDGRDLALGVSFVPLDPPGPFGGFDPNNAHDVVNGARAALPGIEVTAGGQAGLLLYMSDALKRDNIYNLLALVVIILGLRIFLGTWRAGAWFALLMVGTTLVLAGLMALFGSPVDVLNNCLFIILCIAGLEDFLFVSWLQLRRPRARVFLRLLSPGFFTSLTSALGFGSLLVSRIDIIRRFGLWAAVGALLEFAAIFLVWPCLLRGRAWTSGKTAFAIPALARASGWRPPRFVAGGLLLAAALSLIALPHLRVEEFPDEMFPSGHPQTELYHYLRGTRNWHGALDVFFPDVETYTPELAAKLAADPNVIHAFGPAELDEWLTRGLPSPDVSTVKWILHNAPDTFYTPDGNSLRVSLYLRDISLSSLGSIMDHVHGVCGDNCQPAGDLVVMHDFVHEISQTLFGSLALSLVLVGVVLAWIAAGTGTVLPVLASSYWSSIILLGTLAIAGVPVNTVNSIFAAVVVGLTGDNAVHYLFAARGSTLAAGLRGRGGATILLSALMTGVSLLFLGMTLATMRKLGVMLASGFLLSLVGDLWILHGLLRKSHGGTAP
jgi:predicted RND superfamily exporter protein